MPRYYIAVLCKICIDGYSCLVYETFNMASSRVPGMLACALNITQFSNIISTTIVVLPAIRKIRCSFSYSNTRRARGIINREFQLPLRLSCKDSSAEYLTIQPMKNAAGQDAGTIKMLGSLFHEPLACTDG